MDLHPTLPPKGGTTNCAYSSFRWFGIITPDCLKAELQTFSSRAGFPRDGLHDLLLDGVKVERSRFLNRRELDEGLAEFRHLLLDEDEAPEFVLEPLS